MNSNICTEFARVGSLEAVAAAHGDGHPWDESTCAAAAEGGHKDLLRWLRSHNCPWGKTTIEAALNFGHTEVLLWARANGCPCDGHARIIADYIVERWGKCLHVL